MAHCRVLELMHTADVLLCINLFPNTKVSALAWAVPTGWAH